MARGPIITDEVRTMVANFHIRHPRWKARIIREKIIQLLRRKDPNVPANWPGINAVQKILAEIRKREKELPINPQDKPWSATTLNEYPVSPEALPWVFQVWVHYNEALDMPLTIREAKWTARLYHLLKERPIEWLVTMVQHYAWGEKATELANIEYVSTADDLLLLTMVQEEEPPKELINKIIKHHGATTRVEISPVEEWAKGHFITIQSLYE